MTGWNIAIVYGKERQSLTTYSIIKNGKLVKIETHNSRSPRLMANKILRRNSHEEEELIASSSATLLNRGLQASMEANLDTL